MSIYMTISNTLLWFLTVIATVVVIGPLKNIHGSSDIIKKFPYIVGLAAADGNKNVNKTVCSGTLIAPDFVLTSAYCTSLLEAGKIRVFSRKSPTVNKTRLAIKVYTHPSYNPRLRLNDLSLINLEKPFTHVNRFVKLSSKKIDRDVDLDCIVIGFGATDGQIFKKPVRAKFGRSACQIPPYNSLLTYILSYTWTDFACTQTVSPLSPHLPCDRSDPLLCNHNRQYGIFSYGYSVDSTNNEPEQVECSDPTVQSRALLVNKHYKWIADKVSGNPEDRISVYAIDGVDVRRSNMTSVDTTTLTSLTPKYRVKSPPDHSSGPDDYPYLVHLHGLADEPMCGGTLITPFHVLTSAYCTIRMTNIHVTATSHHKLLEANADMVYTHPAFDPETLFADISIVVLRDSINVSKYAEIADFPDPSDANETAVMPCAVVAKMPTAPFYYRASVKAKYGPNACRNASDLEVQTFIEMTRREFICGLYENRLQEDTGNPLICNGMQYGVISHGYKIEHPNANINEQMRFLAVKNYKRWIVHVVTKNKSEIAAGKRVKNNHWGLITAIIVLLLSDLFRRL